MLELYFLRHGQTASSRENAFCGSGSDIPLTAEGLEMASAFAEHYKGIPWQAIYSSPLQRTVHSAETIASPLGMTVQIDERLTEIGYGKWEGLTVDEVERLYHDEHLSWTADPAWYPPTNGESATEVASRVLDAIGDIKDTHKTGKVLIVSHKATTRIALCALLGIDVGRFRYRLASPVGSVSVVQFGPLIEQIGDRAHLSERLRELPGT